MAAIDDLIAQIEDPALRARIAEEVGRLAKQKKFGLVFEEHLPEVTPLYEVPLKRGTVAARPEDMSRLFYVADIEGDIATCVEKGTKAKEQIPVSELVTVASFGKPIYPYLEALDSVENAPDSALWHTLIEADNYHALQLLDYLYHGKVDCIYIDPPYNTGAKDWKYNNDYVDGNDQYRHSKWLSMMQKRLQLAKKLLKDDGVLIVTIDDNEEAYLWILLQEIFPERKLFSVAIQHNPRGTQGDQFAVSHETAIYALTSKSAIYRKIHKGDDTSNLRKWGNQSTRSTTSRATTFFPIIVDEELNIIGFGEVEDTTFHPSSSNIRHGNNIYVYPIDGNGIERKWRYSKQNEKEILPFLIAKRNRTGIIEIMIQRESENTLTVWTNPQYNAEEYGTKLISRILDRKFPFPKSLYAVHNSIWHAIANKPHALILDFFAGSGTTLHAVNLLNAEDGGNRRCILVTNNEVSVDEAKTLTNEGHKPGDEAWEKLGIARYVTWPRTVCSIEGHDVNGAPLKGNYLGSDRPMADGFAANAAFFHLGFLDRNAVARGTQLEKLLSLLWLKAGAIGKCPEAKADDKMMIFPENRFAVLVNSQYAEEFRQELSGKQIKVAYIITDYENEYKSIADSLHVSTTYQLYRDYLDNFTINTGRD